MSRASKSFMAGVMITALFFCASAVFAEMGGGRHGKGCKMKGKMYENCVKQLDLTEEQQEKMKAQKKEHRKKSMETKEKLREKKEELGKELQKQTPEESRIKVLKTEIKALTGDQIDQRVESVLSMKKILTSEQFKKLQDMKEYPWLTRMKKQLDLTPEQAEQIKPIIKEKKEKHCAIMKKFRGEEGVDKKAVKSEMKSLGDETEAKIEKILDAKQMKKWRKIKDKKSKKKGKGKRGWKSECDMNQDCPK